MRGSWRKGALVCALGLILVSSSFSVQAGPLPKGFRLEPVLTGLVEPTSIAAAPDGRLLITERGGALRVVDQGELRAAPLCTLTVSTAGEAGLLGVAVHPGFSSNGWVYLYATATNGVNRVTRVSVTREGCSAETPILSDLGTGPSSLRLGGGIAFGPDGKLYVATGDFENGSSARDDGSLAGKILRVNDDGSVPGDNPTAGSLVFAKGVRNARGLAVGADGRVVASDSGAAFDTSSDELNVVPAGGDLGWNAASGNSGGAYDDPLVSWDPTIGAAGVAIYGARAFPDLADDGLDSDHDRFGADEYPGVRRVDDNAQGTCIGSVNNGLPCTSNAQCPTRPDVDFGFFNEASRCEFLDDPAEYCPGGVPAGDDGCGKAGAIGIDEPDESYIGSIFMAATTGNEIVRAVLDGDGDFASSAVFLDSAALPNCPTAWRDVVAGNDGFLYAIARNGGGSQGGLYRIIHDGEIGPREVAKGSHFPLVVKKGGIASEVELYFEDLRSDALQPRDNGTNPQAPAREYSVWMGTLGSYYSHSVVSGLGATAGTAVNDAMRRVTVSAGTGSKYFLVSARSANLEGPLGAASDGTPRPGAATVDLCSTIGAHGAPNFDLWKCGQNFTLRDEFGQTRELYEFRGQVLVIDFSAIWCPPCRSEADVLENLQDDYRDRGVQVLTVLMDEESNGPNWYGRPSPEECRNWSDRADPNPDHTFPCVVDSLTNDKKRLAWPLYNKWSALPTNVVLDSGLRVVYTGGGYDESTIRQKLDLLVGTTDTCLP